MTAKSILMFGESLQMLGPFLEFCGVILMAHRFLEGMEQRSWLRLIVSALFRGPTARGALRLGIRDEQGVKILQGLSLIALGFMAQLTGTAITVLVQYWGRIPGS